MEPGFWWGVLVGVTVTLSVIMAVSLAFTMLLLHRDNRESSDYSDKPEDSDPRVVRCAGGIVGCYGGIGCTSDHK